MRVIDLNQFYIVLLRLIAHDFSNNSIALDGYLQTLNDSEARGYSYSEETLTNLKKITKTQLIYQKKIEYTVQIIQHASKINLKNINVQNILPGGHKYEVFSEVRTKIYSDPELLRTALNLVAEIADSLPLNIVSRTRENWLVLNINTNHPKGWAKILEENLDNPKTIQGLSIDQLMFVLCRWAIKKVNGNLHLIKKRDYLGMYLRLPRAYQLQLNFDKGAKIKE